MKKKKLKITYEFVADKRAEENLNYAFDILFEAMEKNGDLPFNYPKESDEDK